jgi:hypothetical protein
VVMRYWLGPPVCMTNRPSAVSEILPCWSVPIQSWPSGSRFSVRGLVNQTAEPCVYCVNCALAGLPAAMARLPGKVLAVTSPFGAVIVPGARVERVGAVGVAGRVAGAGEVDRAVAGRDGDAAR